MTATVMSTYGRDTSVGGELEPRPSAWPAGQQQPGEELARRRRPAAAIAPPPSAPAPRRRRAGARLAGLVDRDARADRSAVERGPIGRASSCGCAVRRYGPRRGRAAGARNRAVVPDMRGVELVPGRGPARPAGAGTSTVAAAQSASSSTPRAARQPTMASVSSARSTPSSVDGPVGQRGAHQGPVGDALRAGHVDVGVDRAGERLDRQLGRRASRRTAAYSGQVVAQRPWRPRGTRGAARRGCGAVLRCISTADAHAASRRRSSSSRAQSSGTSPQPKCRARLGAGNIEWMSSVAVNKTLMRSSWSTPLRSTIASSSSTTRSVICSGCRRRRWWRPGGRGRLGLRRGMAA